MTSELPRGNGTARPPTAGHHIQWIGMCFWNRSSAAYTASVRIAESPPASNPQSTGRPGHAPLPRGFLQPFPDQLSVSFWRKVVVCLLGGRTLMIAAVSARRLSKLTLECAIEGRLRFVPDVGCDFRDAPRCLFERPRGQLKPPAGQIRHGWLGEVPGKALHQSGP